MREGLDLYRARIWLPSPPWRRHGTADRRHWGYQASSFPAMADSSTDSIHIRYGERGGS